MHEDFRSALEAKAAGAARVVASLRLLAWSMRRELQGSDGRVSITDFDLAIAGEDKSSTSCWWVDRGGIRHTDEEAVEFGVLRLARALRDDLYAHAHGAKGTRVEQIRTEALRIDAVAVLLEGLVRR